MEHLYQALHAAKAWAMPWKRMERMEELEDWEECREPLNAGHTEATHCIRELSG